MPIVKCRQIAGGDANLPYKQCYDGKLVLKSSHKYYACASYMVDNIFNAASKTFREEYVGHHSNRNKVVKSDSTGIVHHRQSDRLLSTTVCQYSAPHC